MEWVKPIIITFLRSDALMLAFCRLKLPNKVFISEEVEGIQQKPLSNLIIRDKNDGTPQA
jgi:hypothetical protein